jgi:hypothetical protein
MTESGAQDLVTVRILGFPLQVHGRAQQQSQEMQREFQLVLGQEQLHPGSVPARLLDLSSVLSARYAGFTQQQEREIEDGIAAGREVLDELVFRVPRDAAAAAGQLRAILDEADEFCRSGQMLVLATPADLVRYRNWYLDQFIRQADGQPPQPWSGPLR